MNIHHSFIGLCIVSGLLVSATPDALAQGDPEIVAKIIEEGKTNNHVWDHLLYLSEEIGTRLTGSSNLEEANKWTMAQFESFGLENCHLHEWGTIPVRFDRGESFARIIEPIGVPLEFSSPSWSPGTDGAVRGKVVKEPTSIEELEAIEEDLEGAWVLAKSRGRGRRGVVAPGETPEIAEQINTRLKEAGIAGRIVGNQNELVLTFGQRGWRDLNFNELSDDVTVYVRRSDYDVLNSRVADGEEVIVEINLDHQFTEGPVPLYNTVAEIPGSELPDEVVIVSAHLDSWDGPGSMGTQDNGTGSSVTLEAARLLMAAGAKPKRTIRFILWTGEEQGLLGSKAYVESLSEEERAKISAVLVDDGGTNYEGGLRCIESMAEMLREATAPINEAFPDMPVEIHVSERMPRGGGSDHASFNAVGIPGFFWDEVGSGGREGKDYRFIHHTQHDTPRYAVPEYLVQSSTCAAVTAYNLASAETLLPRAPEVAEPERRQRRADPEVQAEAEAPKEDDVAKDVEVAESPINGAWVTTWGEEEDRSFTMNLALGEDGVLRGTSVSERGEGRITKGTFDSATGKFTLVLETSGVGEINFDGKLEGDAMSGTMGIPDMFEAPFKATRKEN
ncbi:MAG: M20/M25/M40 family metallo-hydrolase [Phycisphaerales bacterium]